MGAVSPRDLYSLLGVSKGATPAEVKKAYRELAKANHPDRNPGNKKAEDRFKKASAAFEVLGDAEKRALYDEFGDESTKVGFDAKNARKYRGWQQQAARAAQAARSPGARRAYRSRGGGTGPGGVDLEELFQGGKDSGGFSFSDLGDSLSDLFGGRSDPGPRARGRSGPRKGEDVDTEITISFKKSIQGGETRIRIARPDRARPQTLTLKVPVGLREGQKIRLAGQGAEGPPGTAQGDLLITVKVRADPLFTREGDNLLLTLPITVGEAIRGATLEVPTLGGRVKLKVPAGSQTGKRLRLKGKGVPERKKKAAGHLFVELQVEVPIPSGSKIDPKLDAALDQIEKAYDHDPRARLDKKKK